MSTETYAARRAQAIAGVTAVCCPVQDADMRIVRDSRTCSYHSERITDNPIA